MIYTITSEFTKLNESQGTVQNSSNIYTLELSDSNVPDSGVLIFPLNKLSFSGTKFLRCIDGNTQARVVSFAEIAAASSSSSADDNVADVIDDMWNDPNADTGEPDEFTDALNDIFNP